MASKPRRRIGRASVLVHPCFPSRKLTLARHPRENARRHADEERHPVLGELQYDADPRLVRGRTHISASRIPRSKGRRRRERLNDAEPLPVLRRERFPGVEPLPVRLRSPMGGKLTDLKGALPPHLGVSFITPLADVQPSFPSWSRAPQGP